MNVIRALAWLGVCREDLHVSYTWSFQMVYFVLMGSDTAFMIALTWKSTRTREWNSNKAGGQSEFTPLSQNHIQHILVPCCHSDTRVIIKK